MDRVFTLLIVTLCVTVNQANLPDTLHYQIRIGESIIGSIATVTTEEAKGTSRRYDRTEMMMAREGETISFEEETVSIEDPAGRLLWFEVIRRGLGPSEWVDTLERIDQGWRRTRSRGGIPLIDTLSKSAPTGPIGIEQMLAASPESIRFVDFDPVAFAPRSVEAKLLRREGPDSTNQTPILSVYAVRDTEGEQEVLQWRGPGGTLWREEEPRLGWVIERREIARSGSSAIFEAMDWPRLPVEGHVPFTPPCRLMVHRTGEGAGENHEPPFPRGPAQKVEPARGAGSWQVALEPRQPPPTTEADRQQWREDSNLVVNLRPGLMIDSDSPEIVRFAKDAIDGVEGPTEEARALERAVHRRIEVRDLGTLFATASQTLRNRTGDCTEHAILLAACCRALGIPARLVAGIVPYDGQMQFHLWTEVYLGGWFDLDATIGRGHRSACAVRLLRWDQPEDGMQDLAIRIQELIGRYRFAVVEER